jgi:P-type E1-E2 ATPase
VDGVIVAGHTSVNEAVMTGESLPVDKTAGDRVSSGTVNQFGTFEMQAEKVGEDSSLQRMIRLVKSADAGKAKIVGVADRWATWIVALALVSAITTGIVNGEVIRAVTVLVVFCPCALVLATPTAIMAGIGNATRHGILVREGDALERLATVKRIAFDKTGTLTHGRPVVAAVEALDAKWAPATLLNLTASAELRSEHPLGKAIVAHHLVLTGACPAAPDAFGMLAGRGVRAVVLGREVVAGNAALLAEMGVTLDDDESPFEQVVACRADGCTIIYVAIDGQLAGFIALSDSLRADALDTVQAIGHSGVKSALITATTAAPPSIWPGWRASTTSTPPACPRIKSILSSTTKRRANGCVWWATA